MTTFAERVRPQRRRERASPRLGWPCAAAARGPDLVLFHGGHGLVAALDPQRRAARRALHRARARSPLVRRLRARPARDDRRRLSRPRARADRRDVSGRRAAAVRRASRSAAPSPPTWPAGSARASPTCAWSRPAASRRGASASGRSAATRKPATTRRSSARSAATTCSSTCSAMRRASPRRRVDIQVDGVRRARFDSRKVSGGGTLLGDLAQSQLPDPAAVGRARRLGVPARPPPDRRDPRGRGRARPAPDPAGRSLVGVRERPRGQSPDARVLLERDLIVVERHMKGCVS